jgi:regulator of replication initiation timing
MDKLTLIMFIGLSGFMLFLFFYIINRDKITENKLAGLELGLEEINQEIFKLKKELKNLKEKNNLTEMETIIEEIVDSVKSVEKKYLSKLNELEERMEILENSSKKKVFDFSNVNTQDEERIKNLYKNGYSIEEISRELRIPAGEIELVLKFSNLS